MGDGGDQPDGAAATAAAFLDAIARRVPVDVPVLLVAAHPDDETIGAGAAMARWRALHLLHVTDGAPHRPDDARAAGFATRAAYAAARATELANALAAGGLAPVRHALGVADQAATAALPDIAAALAALIARLRPAALVTHAYEGGHPDHDACACAAQRAVAAAGSPAPARIEMAGYHAAGAGMATGCFLPGPQPVATLTLDAGEALRKRAMLDAFVSQRATLAPFGTATERFRAAPVHDFARPPYEGPLHYERFDWGLTGAGWRARAAAC